MLVHSLWQGLVFTIITGVVMLVTKKSSAQVRYTAVSVLFFLFIAVCGATFITAFFNSHTSASAQGTAMAASGLNGIQLAFKIFSGYFSANASLIVLGWFIVFCAKCVRMATSLAYSHRVKHYKTHQPPIFWKNKIAALSNGLRIKKAIRLLESEIVKLPVVIGHFKPIVFIPLGLLNSMPAGEMEAVLLHELAHIRRNDYFVNFIQVIAENIFFFNPALLWMSSLLREERENCCDDVALAETKSKKQFIQALISFKEHALHVNSYTTAFPAKKNQLLLRVTRIVKSENKTLNTAEKIFFMASFIVLALLTIAVSNGQGVAGEKKGSVNIKQTAAITTEDKIQPAIDAAFKPMQNAEDLVEAKEEQSAQNDNPAAFLETKQAKAAAAEQMKLAMADNKTLALVNEDAQEDEKGSTDAQQAELDRQQALKDKARADEDRIQADKDRQQADEDRKQADADRLQAEEDQKQAMRDQEQAKREQAQAIRDQQQADIDRIQAEKGRTEARKNRIVAQQKVQQH
jgi:beta-lactamase regulating signal transducer with metallopeptidase domain